MTDGERPSPIIAPVGPDGGGPGAGARRALSPLLLLLLLSLLVGGVYSLSTTSGAAELVEHTREVSAALTELQKLMADAETGERGYLVTGDARFLEPNDLARARLHEQLAVAARLTQDDPVQQENLRRLAPMLDAKMDETAS